MKISREIKTGIIVLTGIFLFILGFSYLKSDPLFDDNITLYAVYNNVGGLQTGTQVTINGFTVGKVKDIKFEGESGKLLVTFTVNNDFSFSKNSVAELYDTGIIGGKGIRINPIFDGGENAQNQDTLTSNIRLGITELLQQKLNPLQQKVEGAVTNADSLLMNFNDILDENTKRDFRESVRRLPILIESFQTSAAAFNGLLAENKGQLDSTITNISTITANFAKISDSLANAGLGKTMKSLQTTVSNLDLLLGKMEKGEGSLGKLMKNEELYNNLEKASKELDLLLQDFRLNPKRYVNVSVFGKKQIEYELPENDPAHKN